ncbi:MAG TPA: dihydrofolate reductase family protein [Actinomycetota bacterium]
MRKVIVSEFLSLDGVMQGPGDANEDRSGVFEHGGWQLQLFDDTLGNAVMETMAQTGAFLLGRVTYEIFAGYWPNAPADDPLAQIINSLPTYVASTTLQEPLEWKTATLLQGDVAEAVARLKEEEGKDIQVIGSGGLVQTLLEHGLVDELRLMIHPLVLGGGKRLFRDGNPKTNLRLVDSTTSTTGVVILTYRPEE